MQQVDVTVLQQVFSKPAADLQQTLSSLFYVSLTCLKYKYVALGLGGRVMVEANGRD